MSVTQAPGRARSIEDRVAVAIPPVIRIAVGLLWLTNAAWKVPPSFETLRRFTAQAVRYPVFGPYSWLVENVVLPNFTPFGWGVLLLESALGAFILLGLATRLWAAIGMLQTIAIALSVMNAPHEWSWSYYLMFLAHLAIFATAAGRTAGLDGVLRPVWARSRSRAARLLRRAS